MGSIKKRYKKRSKAPIYKTKGFWFGSLLLLTIIAFFLIFLYLPFYQIEEIEITGTNLTSKEALETMIERNIRIGTKPLESRSSLFFCESQVSTEITSRLPHIEKIQIKKIFPDKLLVKVKERDADLAWCVSSKDCFEIDITGIAFKGAVDKEEKIEVIDDTKGNLELGEKVFPQNRIEEILDVKDNLKEDFNYKIKKIIIPEKRSLFIKTSEGFELRFDFKGDFKKQLKRLDIFLQKEIEDIKNLEYIELRYGNQIYYK